VPKLAFDRSLEHLANAETIFDDLPQGEIAREIVEDGLRGPPPRLPDGRWAVSVLVSGLRLFAVGNEELWAILRPRDVDEADATAAASKVHAALGSRHSEWDADR
jgi:hypothetical protein